MIGESNESRNVFGSEDSRDMKEAEAGLPVGELLRKHGVGKNTFYVWRAK